MPVRFVASCRAVLAAVLLLAFAAPAAAAELYVGPAGSDENTGTDAEHPVATLAHALTLVGAGDTVRVLGNLSGTGNVEVTASLANLTIEGYGPAVSDADSDTWPVIDAASSSMGLGLGADGMTVRRLTFVGGTYGLMVSNVRDATVDHCRFGSPGYTTNTGLGVIESDGCTLSDCLAATCNAGVSVSGTYSGASLGNSITNLQASGCLNVSLLIENTSNLVVAGGACTMSSSSGTNIAIEHAHDIVLSGMAVTGGAYAIMMYEATGPIAVTSCAISGANTCGIHLFLAFGVCIAGNSIHDNPNGLWTTYLPGLLLVGNSIANSSGAGLSVSTGSGAQGYAFLNTFSGNGEDLASVSGSDAVICSPVRLHFNAGERAVKTVLGNHYSNWSGTDANGDGIADSPRVSAEVTDPAPLMADYFANPGNASLHWFAGSGVTGGPLHLRNAGSSPDRITLADQASAVFSADDDTGAGQAYRGGRTGAGDGFAGWLCTVDSLPADQSLALALGHTAIGGSDFQPAGPAGEIVGDGYPRVHPFTLTGPTARIPEGRHLALRVTNQTGAEVAILTGLAWLGLSASLPPVSLAPVYLGLLDDPVITY